VNPVADLRVMNLLEDCGGRICGTELLFCHALDPIPTDLAPMEALARAALGDPMVGPAQDRAQRICEDIRRFGAEGVVISRIPGASHCALEGGMFRDIIGERMGLPVLEIEVPPLSDAMTPALRTRLEAIVEALLPRALVFTPNLAEASAILREVVEGVEGMKKAARSLKTLGPACVVVKGGHMGGAESPDVFFDGREMVELSAHRIRAQDDHGTGCVFSAAVAARLARGQNPLDAAAGGKMDVRRALENALRIGGGRGPVNPVPVDTTGA